MKKNRKYYPDYSRLYPGVEISPEVLTALRKSDRKMKYMEYELKAQRPVRDEDGILIALLPGREDSLERLIEMDKQFMVDALPMEDIVLKRVDLCRAVAHLDDGEKALIYALFYQGLTEKEYAAQIHRKQQTINKRKQKIICKLLKLLTSGC